MTYGPAHRPLSKNIIQFFKLQLFFNISMMIKAFYPRSRFCAFQQFVYFCHSATPSFIHLAFTTNYLPCLPVTSIKLMRGNYLRLLFNFKSHLGPDVEGLGFASSVQLLILAFPSSAQITTQIHFLQVVYFTSRHFFPC